MLDGMKNEVLVDELVLKYDAYWRTWNRVLFMNQREGNRWVEVNLTPINPTVERNWGAQVFPLVIRFHHTGLAHRDKLFRAVAKNSKSTVYQKLKQHMLEHVPIEITHRLLLEDFLSFIDWARYTENNFGQGGVPFALCKQKIAVAS
jgi:hypothetical protein